MVVIVQAPQHVAQSPPSMKHWSTPAALPSSVFGLSSQVASTAVPVVTVPSVVVNVHVSTPPYPYDVGEMRSARSRRVPSINVHSTAGRALPPRPFQTLISHVDVVRIVARNRDGVIAIFSLRRRGNAIRVTAARSQRVPSVDFLSAAGRALIPRLPDTGFARRWISHCRP